MPIAEALICDGLTSISILKSPHEYVVFETREETGNGYNQNGSRNWRCRVPDHRV